MTTKRRTTAKTKFKRAMWTLAALLATALSVWVARQIDERWMAGSSLIEHIGTNLTAQASGLKVLGVRLHDLEERLAPVPDHEHVYPDKWSEPHQLTGNYVRPQFYQHRLCVICKHGEVRLVE